MLLPRPPFDPNNQIPNEPFKSTESWTVLGQQATYITGEGISIDPSTGVISSVSDPGIEVIYTTGGITGGPITSTGTLSLEPSGVIPGNYKLSQLTVDAYGRVIEAAPTPPASEQESGPIKIASFFQVGEACNTCNAVTPAGLQSIKTSSVTNTSQTKIATALAVKTVHDLVVNKVGGDSFTAKGDILAGKQAGQFSALGVGTDGQVLKACALCETGLTWATDEAGDDIPCSLLTAKGNIVAASAANTPTAFPVGSDGQILTACSACSSGLEWKTPAPAVSSATPIVAGIVFGCTPTASNLSLGYGALESVTFGVGNVALGCSALGFNTVGNRNVAVGPQALLQNINGEYNVFVGDAAGFCNTSGISNTGVGYQTNYLNQSSNRNSAFGFCALHYNLGNENTAVGANSLLNVVGDNNTALGYNAGSTVTSGSSNTLIGPNAGSGIQTGSGNIVVGNPPTLPDLSNNIIFGVSGTNIRLQINQDGAWSPDGTNYGTAGQVLQSNGPNAIPSWVTPSGGGGGGTSATPTSEGVVYALTQFVPPANVAVGGLALSSLTSGLENTAAGSGALGVLTTGSYNVAMGACALICETSGIGNVALGHSAMALSVGAAVNVAVGPAALEKVTGNCNVGVGMNALRAVTTGSHNVGLGAYALYSTTSSDNLGVGDHAAACNTTGCHITALGYCASYSNISAQNNTSVGYLALLRNCYADSNTAIGTYSMSLLQGSAVSGLCCAYNTAVGYQSHYSGDGSFNTAIGTAALYSTTGSAENTAVGAYALYTANVNSRNTGVGFASFCQTLGSNNTGLGYHSGHNSVTGSNNVTLGYCSGADVMCNLVSQSNHVILGNDSTSCVVQKVASTVASDIRYKKVAGGVPLSLPFVENLETIKYQFCDVNTGEVTDERYRYGFSAQNVIENEEDPTHPIIGGISNPDMYTLNPTELIPVLVNAIKELSAEVKALKQQINP